MDAEKVWEIVCYQSGCDRDELTLDTRLNDIFDSLDLAEITLDLEAESGGRIDDADLPAIRDGTIGGLIDYCRLIKKETL